MTRIKLLATSSLISLAIFSCEKTEKASSGNTPSGGSSCTQCLDGYVDVSPGHPTTSTHPIAVGDDGNVYVTVGKRLYSVTFKDDNTWTENWHVDAANFASIGNDVQLFFNPIFVSKTSLDSDDDKIFFMGRVKNSGSTTSKTSFFSVSPTKTNLLIRSTYQNDVYDFSLEMVPYLDSEKTWFYFPTFQGNAPTADKGAATDPGLVKKTYLAMHRISTKNFDTEIGTDITNTQKQFNTSDLGYEIPSLVISSDTNNITFTMLSNVDSTGTSNNFCQYIPGNNTITCSPHTSPSGGVYPGGSPVKADQGFYFGTSDGTLFNAPFVVDASIFTVPDKSDSDYTRGAGDYAIHTAPVFVNGTIYLQTTPKSSTLYALDSTLDTTKQTPIKWCWSPGNTFNPDAGYHDFIANPVLSGNILYVAKNDTVYAFDTSKEATHKDQYHSACVTDPDPTKILSYLGKFQASSWIRATPTLDSVGHLYFISEDGHLYRTIPDDFKK